MSSTWAITTTLGGRALDDAGCRIVTRFKKNTPLAAIQSTPVEPGSDVVSDRIGFLPGRQAKNRKNPMQGAVREIVVTMETGGTLRILSNDLDAPANEIADLYKRRWQIELFFRVMKQTLKITHFIGRSENAVRTQIAVALIAFLLLNLLRKMTQGSQSLLETARTRARQPHASQRLHPPQETATTAAARLAPTLAELELNMNRTAVGSSPAMTAEGERREGSWRYANPQRASSTASPRMKSTQAASCETAMNSSGLCAWSIEPGPQTTVGRPAAWKCPASVANETACQRFERVSRSASDAAALSAWAASDGTSTSMIVSIVGPLTKRVSRGSAT